MALKEENLDILLGRVESLRLLLQLTLSQHLTLLESIHGKENLEKAVAHMAENVESGIEALRAVDAYPDETKEVFTTLSRALLKSACRDAGEPV